MPMTITMRDQIIGLAIIGAILSISSLPVANTLSFKLSRLLYEEETDVNEERHRPVFPRRDLAKEFGENALQCLVESALAVDGGICLNGDLETSRDDASASSPSASPTPLDIKKSGQRNSYGVDVSFPIHSMNAFANPDETKPLSHTPLDDRISFYMDFLKGCKSRYDPYLCNNSERDRYDMNLNQPPVMANYTILGFQKTTAPADLMATLYKFWNDNYQDNDGFIDRDGNVATNLEQEKWYPGDTHTNHWDAKTYMMDVADGDQWKGGGMYLRQRIFHAVSQSLGQWIHDSNKPVGSAASKSSLKSKLALTPVSLYGIRVYSKNAVLSPHVDRLPLVTSAIINVAQNVDEPWPLEVYGHDGKAYNVTLEPGEMLLYESHSVIHGRPFPLKGKYYANVFVHFEPDRHCIKHAERMQGKELPEDVEEMYKRAQRKQHARQKAEASVFRDLDSENGSDELVTIVKSNSGSEVIGSTFSAEELPFFIQPGTYNSDRWKQQIKYKKDMSELQIAVPPSLANTLASKGDFSSLRALIMTDSSVVSRGDVNGWQPLHEAARSGNTKIIKYLIEEGADVNARTNNGIGGTALWWAEEQNGVDSDSAVALREAGAVRIAPNFSDQPKGTTNKKSA